MSSPSPRVNDKVQVDPRLREVATDVFVINSLLRVLPGVTIPLRTTVIRDPATRQLTVYSPVPPTLHEDLSALGTVTAIIAPVAMHTLFAHQALAAFPSATLYSAPTIPKRVPDRDWGTIVTADTPSDTLGAHVDMHLTCHHPFMEEIILVHRRSGTLVVADLVFNFTPSLAASGSFLFRLYISVTDAKRPLNTSAPLRAMLASGGQATLSALDSILDMEWDAVIPCHGDIVHSGAKKLLKDELYSSIKNKLDHTGYGRWSVMLTAAALALAAFLLKLILSTRTNPPRAIEFRA